MSEQWIIYVEFPIVTRRCGIVEVETEEQAIAVSLAFRDRIIAEDVIPSALITVRRNTAEQLGVILNPPAPPEATPPPAAAPSKAATTKRKS
jgi:hypothetical protein